jgi:hypothetical protein
MSFCKKLKLKPVELILVAVVSVNLTNADEMTKGLSADGKGGDTTQIGACDHQVTCRVEANGL